MCNISDVLRGFGALVGEAGVGKQVGNRCSGIHDRPFTAAIVIKMGSSFRFTIEGQAYNGVGDCDHNWEGNDFGDSVEELSWY